MGVYSNALAIMGKGTSRCRLPLYQYAGLAEVWTLNNDYMPSVTTRHFNVHVPMTQLEALAEIPADIPVVVLDPEYCAKHPGTYMYPLAEVREHFGWKEGQEYLSTTPAYMIALGIMLGKWDTLIMCGIDFDWRNRQEAVWERPCVEWYTGWAEAKGIKVVIPEESNLCTTGEGLYRGPYGITETPRESNGCALPANLVDGSWVPA